MTLAADAFAAIADSLSEVADTVRYSIVRPNHQTTQPPNHLTFSIRAIVTEGESALTMVGDAAAPTDTPTKLLRVLFDGWPQTTPPRVDDEITFADGSVYRVASAERRLGGYYLITASKRRS